MTLPTITALPDPPNRAADSNAAFVTKGDGFLGALPGFGSELNAFAPALIALAAVANYSTYSTSSVTIGAGAKSFTVEAGKMYSPGTPVMIASASAPSAKWMFGQVSTYNFATGALVVDSQRTNGSGTYTDWIISLSGPQGQGGDVLPNLSGNDGKVLGVVSGAAAWVDDGWEQIGTVSPSGASSTTFTSIGSTYEDLLCTFNFTQTSGGLGLLLSPDGTTFSSSVLFGSSMTAPKGAVFIPGHRKDWGWFTMNVASGGSSPVIATLSNNNGRWLCTGGISALRFVPEVSNLSGTATLFGRR